MGFSVVDATNAWCIRLYRNELCRLFGRRLFLAEVAVVFFFVAVVIFFWLVEAVLSVCAATANAGHNSPDKRRIKKGFLKNRNTSFNYR